MKVKTKTQPAFFLLFSIIIGLASCNKNDEIDINHLLGNWYIYNDDPNLSLDGSTVYKFKADKTCSITYYDALSNWDTIVNRTYVISNTNDLISMYNEENIYTEQYNILKLTAGEMIWENASPCDGNTNKKLRKLKD